MPKVQKMPAIMFYTGDWLKDPAVRMLTLEQRGLWIDMLALMYESTDRGYLSLKNGNAVSVEQLSRMVGSSTEEVSECLQAMECVGVFSKTDEGVIYNRRMVDDEKIREAKSKAGKASGEKRKRTKVEQKSNKLPTPLEYENENENEILLDVSSSEKYINKNIVAEVWNSIPSKRQRGRGKFSNSLITNVIRCDVDIEKVKTALTNYYNSDEGKGKYWRTPATLIEDLIWEEDNSQWNKERGKEEKFPQCVFEHEKILKRYKEESEENQNKVNIYWKGMQEQGFVESEIIRRFAHKVWTKYPNLRK
ncbi:MAG: hypothetical protein Unbinned97contig1000_28 [Prokaryotic dsDNA virus sp.]|nr:MAG: hypothetical protein Unbinned97contig1000_28 [Prokaryotic dsDNA virus sp.]|tara:strand:- start:257 stop:1174 length:918 start_codon:yes stop_codon:yes gene_type:complete